MKQKTNALSGSWVCICVYVCLCVRLCALQHCSASALSVLMKEINNRGIKFHSAKILSCPFLVFSLSVFLTRTLTHAHTHTHTPSAVSAASSWLYNSRGCKCEGGMGCVWRQMGVKWTECTDLILTIYYRKIPQSYYALINYPQAHKIRQRGRFEWNIPWNSLLRN